MTRNVWSDRPLGVKLSALVATGAVSLGVFAVITVQALEGTGERVELLQRTAQASERALTADQAHDAVRSDVLQALLGSDRQSASQNLEQHTATLRDELAAVSDAGLGDDVTAAVEEVTPDVDAYAEAGRAISDLAAENTTAARRQYPEFLKAFKALEASLPSVAQAVEQHAAKAAAASAEQRATAITLALVVAATGVALLALLGWVVTRSVVRPLRRVGAVVSAMADGDLTGSTGVSSRDEVGRMAAELETSMAQMREVITAIGDSSTTLASATEQLTASAHDMARLADESSTQSGIVAHAATDVSQNVQTVAAGSEQMGASIREIAQNASEVSRVAQQAVSAADATTATVAKLGESSLEIAGVVKVITSIAEQTNLLALNATIEAARAGEAGKGFAVVANEVKELAQETAKATEDIAQRVQAIQGDTEGAVRAIGEISQIIGLINDSQGTIAAAVEEQTATTTEMNRNVAEAAMSADQIAANIAAVASATDSTTRAMGDAQAAIDEVAKLATTLQSSVARFRY